jgi:ribosomal protein L11 methyltransferase
VRTWPALELRRLNPAHTIVGAGTETAPPAGAAESGAAGCSRVDLLQAALLDYHIAAIDEAAADLWRVFFSTDGERDRAAGDLGRQFPGLAIEALDVADEDWVAKSQAQLRTVRVGNIIVAPPWDIPHTGKVKIDPSAEFAAARLRRPVVIVIRPSMGFGTGHHATTRLCLAELQRLELQGRSAIDVGTGSGVLAIAASRVGAAPVVAIDDDENAVHAAEDNLTLNRGADVALRVADFRSLRDESFDLVLANLTGGLLIASAEQLQELARRNGRLILSGFLRHEEDAVLAAYPGVEVVHRSQEEEWVSVTLQRA